MRTNRGVLPHLISEALDKGSSLFVRNKNMLLVRFVDEKDLYVLTKSVLRKDQTSKRKCVCVGGRASAGVRRR